MTRFATALLLQARDVEAPGLGIVSADQWRDEETAHAPVARDHGQIGSPRHEGAAFPLLRSREEARL